MPPGSKPRRHKHRRDEPFSTRAQQPRYHHQHSSAQPQRGSERGGASEVGDEGAPDNGAALVVQPLSGSPASQNTSLECFQPVPGMAPVGYGAPQHAMNRGFGGPEAVSSSRTYTEYNAPGSAYPHQAQGGYYQALGQFAVQYSHQSYPPQSAQSEYATGLDSWNQRFNARVASVPLEEQDVYSDSAQDAASRTHMLPTPRNAGYHDNPPEATSIATEQTADRGSPMSTLAYQGSVMYVHLFC